jgi:hypothetical protein
MSEQVLARVTKLAEEAARRGSRCIVVSLEDWERLIEEMRGMRRLSVDPNWQGYFEDGPAFAGKLQVLGVTLIPSNEKYALEVEQLNDALAEMKSRYTWAANELLACDYGDNEHSRGNPGQPLKIVVGWRVYGWRAVGRVIYGDSIDEAIDIEIARAKAAESADIAAALERAERIEAERAFDENVSAAFQSHSESLFREMFGNKLEPANLQVPTQEDVMGARYDGGGHWERSEKERMVRLAAHEQSRLSGCVGAAAGQSAECERSDRGLAVAVKREYAHLDRLESLVARLTQMEGRLIGPAPKDNAAGLAGATTDSAKVPEMEQLSRVQSAIARNISDAHEILNRIDSSI